MKKKDLRIVKTLSQIDRALLKWLKDSPFQKITVDALCQTAMINRSTFYKYYIDKYDLLDQYLERTLDEFREHVDVEFINATPKKINDISYNQDFSRTLAFILSKKEIYLILWDAAIDRKVYSEMTGVIHDSILSTMVSYTEKHSNQKKYADLYAYLFATNMMSMVRWWFEYSESITQEEVEDIMASNMEKGMFLTFKKQVNEQKRKPADK